jgi:hypothetical protein
MYEYQGGFSKLNYRNKPHVDDVQSVIGIYSRTMNFFMENAVMMVP